MIADLVFLITFTTIKFNYLDLNDKFLNKRNFNYENDLLFCLYGSVLISCWLC